MIQALLISLGNPLRGDDAVAHRAAGLVNGLRHIAAHQLTPELAAEMPGAPLVVFVDADVCASAVELDSVAPAATPPLSHYGSPSEITELARAVYSFSGEVYLCRIPARDFALGASLSPQAEHEARRAAHAIAALLSSRRLDRTGTASDA